MASDDTLQPAANPLIEQRQRIETKGERNLQARSWLRYVVAAPAQPANALGHHLLLYHYRAKN